MVLNINGTQRMKPTVFYGPLNFNSHIMMQSNVVVLCKIPQQLLDRSITMQDLSADKEGERQAVV